MPFQPEDDTRKRKGANQLRVALVQASGLPEGSPLVVFEVVSNDQVLHRWRSQERKKTSQPVWRQQWAVALDAKASCPKLRTRLEDVSRGELMGDLSIDLTTVLDREIHRGWHKLVGEATDKSETITVELGGAAELVVQWRHSTSKVKAVVPPRTPKPAVASPAGISAGIEASTTKKVFFGAGSIGMAAAAGARARRRAAARAVPELAEAAIEAPPEDDASLDLVEDYSYVSPWDVHAFWNREVFTGEQWQQRRVRVATEVATGFSFLLHGVPAPLDSPVSYLDERRFSLRRAHLCDVRVCRFAGRDHVVRVAAAAVQRDATGRRPVADCRVCCESAEAAWALRRAILGKRPELPMNYVEKLPSGKRLPLEEWDRDAAELCRAAGAGDLERVKELLESGTTGEDANGAGEAAVSHAVRHAVETGEGRDRQKMERALRIVRLLMEQGADPFAVSCLGASARDVLEAPRGRVPDAVLAAIRRELDRAAIAATADGGSLVVLTNEDAARARELLRMRAARECRARRQETTGWTAEDERLDQEDTATEDEADPLYGVKLRRYPRHGVAAVFSSDNGTVTRRQERRALAAKYRIRQALERHADPKKDPRYHYGLKPRYDLGKKEYKGPTLTGSKDADAVRLLFHRGHDNTSVESGPQSIEDTIVPKRPAPAKRLVVTPVKRRPTSAAVALPAAHDAADRVFGEYNIHQTHAEPQLRRIRGLLEAGSLRGRPSFIKQNLHLPGYHRQTLAFHPGKPPRASKRRVDLAHAVATARTAIFGGRPVAGTAVARPSSAGAARSASSSARPRPSSAAATSQRRRTVPAKAPPRHNARPRSAPVRRRPVAPPPNWSTPWAKPVPNSSSRSGDLFL